MEQSARINTKTHNRAALAFYERMKKEGVENIDFMLALNNKDLIGVNPFSKRLSTEMKMAIVKEAYLNYWYFAVEIMRIKIDKTILTSSWLLLNSITTISTCTRDTMISAATVSPLIIVWHAIKDVSMETSETSNRFQIIVHNKTMGKMTLQVLSRFFSIVPQYFLMPFPPQSYSDNDGCYSKANSQLTTITAVSNVDFEETGTSPPSLLTIEGYTTVPGMLRYLITHKDPITAGVMFMYDVAGDTRMSEGRAAFELKNNLLKFDNSFFSQDADLIKERLVAHSPSGAVYCEFESELSESEMEDLISDSLMTDEDTIGREFKMRWVN